MCDCYWYVHLDQLFDELQLFLAPQLHAYGMLLVIIT